MDVGLSILIPFYNEPTVVDLIKKLYTVDYGANITFEIIAVDDGSSLLLAPDDEEYLRSLMNLTLLRHEENRGKGAAIKTALQHSKGKVVIVQDGDLEYDPADIAAVIAPIFSQKTKVCYGSRHLSKEQRRNNIIWFKKHMGQSLPAFFGGRVLTLLCSLLFMKRLTDIPTCYKAFDAQFIKSLPLRENGFEMEVELTVKTLKQTHIVEVSIHYYARTRAEGKKITWKDGFRSLFALFRYRFSAA